MRKQALIIGLGQFGLALARSLTSRGLEVMAVDRRTELVQEAAEFAAEAVSFDATDDAALSRAAPDRRDLCVVAIGGESRDGSIVCTALLRQMGAPYIVARAMDEIHERILRLVGAHEVVNPEQAYGERLASRLAYRGVLDQVPLGDDLILTELKPPEKFIGRTLTDIALPRKYGVTVVAIRQLEEGRGRVVKPDPTVPLREGDILVIVASEESVARMMERL